MDKLFAYILRSLFHLLPPILHQLSPPQTMEATIFSLFPSLLAELRIHIWHETLPENVEKALQFYKKGCWLPRYLTEADTNNNPHDDEQNLVFEFHHELIDNIQFILPSFLSTAKPAVLRWPGFTVRVLKYGSTRRDSALLSHARSTPNMTCTFHSKNGVTYF